MNSGVGDALFSTISLFLWTRRTAQANVNTQACRLLRRAASIFKSGDNGRFAVSRPTVERRCLRWRVPSKLKRRSRSFPGKTSTLFLFYRAKSSSVSRFRIKMRHFVESAHHHFHHLQCVCLCASSGWNNKKKRSNKWKATTDTLNTHTCQPVSSSLFFFLTAKEHLEAEMDKPKHIVSFKRKHNLTKPAQISSSRGTETFISLLVFTRCSLSVWLDEDPCCVILKYMSRTERRRRVD